MNPVYLGVDVAGAKNTWVSVLSCGDDEPFVVHGPRLASLKEIVAYCDDHDVLAAVVDAQLAIALSDEGGVRSSDDQLRAALPKDCRVWVMSFNSLMAVPIRGRLLADHLSPRVGTLLETHPRASLLFGLGHVEEIHKAIREYKRKRNDSKERTGVRAQHTKKLWHHWSGSFGVRYNGAVEHDGALDSLVCATVAYLFHHAPGRLRRLRHEAADTVGGGPFYVVAPNAEPGAL